MRNFKSRLMKLFSSNNNLLDEEIEDVFVEAVDELYYEVFRKNNGIKKPKLDIIADTRAITVDELPENNKEAIAGTYRNNDNTYELVICPENTRKYFEKVKHNYNNLVDYIWCSAAHEISHAITYYLGKWVEGYDHSPFWYNTYKELKKRYTDSGVGWDYANNVGDFCIKSNRNSKPKNRVFVPRYPDGYATGTHNTNNPICKVVCSKEDFDRRNEFVSEYNGDTGVVKNLRTQLTNKLTPKYFKLT